MQHLVAIHLKDVAHVVNEQRSVQQLQQSWSLLQQSVGLVDSYMTSEACLYEWIRCGKKDTCGSLCRSLVAQAYLMFVLYGSNTVVFIRLMMPFAHSPAHARARGSFSQAPIQLLTSHSDVLAVAQV